MINSPADEHIEKILTHPIETDEDYQRLGELVEDSLATSAIVQGFKWSEDKWLETMEEMHEIGNQFNRHLEGDAGYLFWETATNIEVLIKRIRLQNKGVDYRKVEDESEENINGVGRLRAESPES